MSRVYPLLPLRDIVVFPRMITPLFISRDKSLAAIEAALKAEDHQLVLFTQKDADVDLPFTADLFGTGTVASVVLVEPLPDGSSKVMLEGLKRVKIEHIDGAEDGCIFVEASDTAETPMSPENQQRLAELMQKYERWANFKELPFAPFPRFKFNPDHASGLIDQIVIYLDASVEDRQKCLDATAVDRRIDILHKILDRRFEKYAEAMSRCESICTREPRLVAAQLNAQEKQEVEKIGKLLNEAPRGQVYNFVQPENVKSVFPDVRFACCRDFSEKAYCYFTVNFSQYSGYELAILTKEEAQWPLNLLNNVVQLEAAKNLKLLDNLDENGCAFFMETPIAKDKAIDVLFSKESFLAGSDACVVVGIAVTQDEFEENNTHDLMHRLVAKLAGRFSVLDRESILVSSARV